MRWSGQNSGVPANAVVGGREKDGSALYVIRGYLDGVGSVVGKYSPRSYKAYFSYGDHEYSTGSFEVIIS